MPDGPGLSRPLDFALDTQYKIEVMRKGILTVQMKEIVL